MNAQNVIEEDTETESQSNEEQVEELQEEYEEENLYHSESEEIEEKPKK